MSLKALICAYHEAAEPGGGLRAALPLAGRSLLERQARLALSAGAEALVILVERVPPPLLAAVDRLRAEGVEVTIARNAAQAADAVERYDRLLVVGDGLIAAEPHLSRLADLDGFAILTMADARADDRHERIDAYSRWAGLALIDGAMLHQTAAMLGDWDLQSTLLRRTVQAGARQLAAGTEEPLLVAEGGDDLAPLERQILSGEGAAGRDWVSRLLLAPLERAAMRSLTPTGITPATLGLTATLLTLLGGLAFAWQWFGLGLAFVLIATPLDGTAERLAALRLQRESGPSWWETLVPVLSAGALLALSFALAPTRGWGCISLGVGIVAFTIASRVEVEGREIPGRLWLAERKGLAWLLLPFAVAGLWGTGLTVLAAYAGASFFWAQRHAHAPAAVPSHD